MGHDATAGMTPEEFRRHGKALVDWIADYWEGLGDVDIIPDVQPGDVRGALPERAPEAPEPFEAVAADLDRIIRPALTHWQAPGWFAYFPAQASFPAILGELAAAGLGQQGMLWATSPAATELEAHVLDWLVDLLGLPKGWRVDTGPGGGVIQMSASDATHTALVVAREQARRRTGVGPDQQVVYASAQAHSSIEKGARVAGIGHLRLLPTTGPGHAVDTAALAAQLAADVAEGLIPALVCAAVGTTGTTAVDDVRAVAEAVRAQPVGEQFAWVHVDAAYAGTAMICPELRHHQDGLELVDSYTTNPHKWLLTNFDCSLLYVADRRPLVETLSILPPYLVEQAAAAEEPHRIDYRDWHVPLGRRFRALKLWFVLRTYGAEGLRAMIRSHLRMAQDLAGRVAAHDRLELVAPTPFGLVSLAHVDGDEATQRVADAVNASGWAHLGTSVLGGRRFVRVSIGSTTTTPAHVDRLWALIEGAA